MGSNPFLAGWGRHNTLSVNSPVLMQVQVPIIRNLDCKESYRRIGLFEDKTQFDDRVVCSGFTNGGKDSCQGDSGGPLMLPIRGKNGLFAFYQIGIVSWAADCAKPNIPGVNVNIQFYAPWIKWELTDESP